MKQFVLVSVLAMLASCSSPLDESMSYEDSMRMADSIRKIDSALRPDSASRSAITDTTAGNTTPVEPMYPAKFRILFTSSYCGGARPSEEMLAEYATPKLLTVSWIKFKNHFTSKEYVLQTNAEGIAEAEMEEGKYDVFLTKDINPKLSTGFDPKCKLWTDQLLLTVKVSSSGKAQDVNIHFICNPCDENMKRRP